MSFLVRKITGCSFSENSRGYKAAIIELHSSQEKFYKFALHLRILTSPASKAVGICRIIFLEEESLEVILDRYITREGEKGIDFPKIDSDLWKMTDPWFARVANGRPTNNLIRVTKARGSSRLKKGVRQPRIDFLRKRIELIENNLRDSA